MVIGRFSRERGNLLRLLPSGAGLPAEDWALRHRVVTVALLAHVPPLALVAVLHDLPGLWASVYLLSIVLSLTLAAASGGRRRRSLAATTGLLVCSAMIVHASAGVVEAHFHYFFAVALVALYEEWTAYAAAIGFVGLQHAILGTFSPQTVFGHSSHDAWMWALIHAASVLLVAMAQMVFWWHNELTRAREQRERHVASALQRSLLPESLPAVRGATVSARYLPADEIGLGGDWYDVLQLPDGTIGVAIGDVAGHGLRAATVMGQLRSALRAYALQGLEPAEALRWLNVLVMSMGDETMATAMFCRVDPARGTVTYASAGHPPLILLTPEGPAVRLLEPPGGIPLGVLEGTDFEQEEHSLRPGDALICYTDGLVERRGESLTDGLARLHESLRHVDVDADADALVSFLLGQMGRRPDDVAVIALRRLSDAPAPHVGAMPVLPGQVGVSVRGTGAPPAA